MYNAARDDEKVMMIMQPAKYCHRLASIPGRKPILPIPVKNSCSQIHNPEVRMSRKCLGT